MLLGLGATGATATRRYCGAPAQADVAERLSAIPEVYFVALITGSYNINASAAFRSNDDHLDFITNRLPRIPGITRTATYNLFKIYKRQMSILPPA
ncbi:MAG TPA: Lrp/AsnC ligand binding domain-containing protein [Alphaproteobacteria bacterium]|nr:Lrp/AsnC ligand binding domain-containing protein [Alphaproteobacteria bacterium]MDP7164563.1 Lrp/AsnC ligand binding domain-containing protein [Alphaproteobacteria bacterium]MDP7427404.1 Lrp/AsnC ligand binding domain-containing protein [Alphaproteobacteria bacterium]HJM48975.1 Lrp/AsnC ligand binding domain-containing protein [Alphaproteobacteria bacterium]